MTAIFVLVKWKIPGYLKELSTGVDGYSIPAGLIKATLIFAATVVAFIIINEIIPFF